MSNKHTVTLLLNDRNCNFNCSYCYARNDHRYQKATPITDFSKIDFIYENILNKDTKQNTTSKIETTFWGGEPLFNPHLKNVVEYLRGKYKSSFFFVTNGSLINDSWADWIINNDVSIVISNDLAFQKNRGIQYLEDDNTSRAIVKIANAGKLSSIQSVYSRQCYDVMANYEYLKNWEQKYDVKKPIYMGMLNIKSYDDSNTDLLFTENPNDKESQIFKGSLYDYCLLALSDESNPNFTSFKKKHLKNAILGLMNADDYHFVKEDGQKLHNSCSVFKEGCYDLTGRKGNCPHYFEKNPDEPVIIKPHTWERCKECLYWGECNGICASADDETRKRSCESMRFFYRTFREIIYSLSDTEKRKKYVCKAVEDLR